MKNIKSLSWWANYYEGAESFSAEVVGCKMTVSIFDVLPNLRAASHPIGAEFDQCEVTAPSMTEGPIFVGRDKYDGRLVITDGHHRFSEAVSAGKRFIEVFVEEEICSWMAPFNRLSQDDIEALRVK